MFEFKINDTVQKNRNLFLAVNQSNTGQVTKLLEEGADPNAMLIDIPVLLAAANGDHWGAFKILLDKGASPNCTNEMGWSPLHECAKKGNVEMIKTLQEKNTFMGRKDRRNKNAVMAAAIGNQTEALRLLIEEYNVSPNVQDNDGNLPTHFAVTHNNIDMLRILLSYSVPTDVKNKKNQSPIDLVAEDNQEMKALLEQAAIKTTLNRSLELDQLKREDEGLPAVEEPKEQTRAEKLNEQLGGVSTGGKRRILKA